MVLSSASVIVGITICCRSFVFSQSRAKVFAGLTNVNGPAVAAFETAHCLCAGLSWTLLISGRQVVDIGLVQRVRYKVVIFVR